MQQILIYGVLPAADAAYIYMHELFPRVVAHATPMKVQRRIAQGRRRNSGQADIDGHGLHVQAVLGYGRRAASQKFVAPRRSIAADNVNFLIRPARGGNQVVEQIEDPRIVGMDFARPVVPQKVFQLLQRHGIIGVSMAIDNIKALVRVRVI
jgi:hypothetical protein